MWQVTVTVAACMCRGLAGSYYSCIVAWLCKVWQLTVCNMAVQNSQLANSMQHGCAECGIAIAIANSMQYGFAECIAGSHS